MLSADTCGGTGTPLHISKCLTSSFMLKEFKVWDFSAILRLSSMKLAFLTY